MCGFFLSGGNSNSNTEFMLRNWKTFKQSIQPISFVQELEIHQFLPPSSFNNLGSISRSHQATLVLIKVYRQVQASARQYQMFVEILRCHNGKAVDELSKAVGRLINKPETGR